MAPFIAEPIYAIFSAPVTEIHEPVLWKQANVIHVPTIKVLKNIRSDLCPISLMRTLTKILESFVGQWMLEKMNDQTDAQQLDAITPLPMPLQRC